jgi:N-acetyl-anhydromuramyl-L-alanine amidase AmpD
VRQTLLPTACLAAALLAACSDRPRQVVEPPATCDALPAFSIEPARVPASSPYDALFTRAEAELGVPAALLRAIAYVETGWQMVEGEEEHGLAPAYGIFALRGERLLHGAALMGLDADRVRRDPAANVRAAAALLRAQADALGVAGEDAAGWQRAVAEFSDIGLAAGRESYAREVEAVMRGRRAAPSPAPALAADPCGTAPPPPPARTDYDQALWHASPNFNERMAGAGGQVVMVIIHSCEGGYTGCWSWLANAVSRVSAHYVVREDGAEITQLVRESARAWHIGAVYDSTLNAGHAGYLHGVQSNHFTIGVEHAGYASQGSWPVAQVEASARLVCDVTRRWGIPRSRLRIVSHGQLQPHNRTDPGPNWPWDDYLARIDRHCAA